MACAARNRPKQLIVAVDAGRTVGLTGTISLRDNNEVTTNHVDQRRSQARSER